VTNGEYSYSAWIEAVRAGQTYITNGPLLNWVVSPKIRLQAECAWAFDKLEIIADGEPVDVARPTEVDGIWRATLEVDRPKNFRWLAARCIGGYSQIQPNAVNFAHSSPLLVGAATRDTRAAESLAKLIPAIREWATQRAVYHEPKWQKQLMDSCTAAEQKLMR
jgi:hypothetical protein